MEDWLLKKKKPVERVIRPAVREVILRRGPLVEGD